MYVHETKMVKLEKLADKYPTREAEIKDHMDVYKPQISKIKLSNSINNVRSKSNCYNKTSLNCISCPYFSKENVRRRKKYSKRIFWCNKWYFIKKEYKICYSK